MKYCTFKGRYKKNNDYVCFRLTKSHPETVYDYMGIPYPEGTWEKKVYTFFQHENINDIVFSRYKIQRETNDTSAGDDNRKTQSS